MTFSIKTKSSTIREFWKDDLHTFTIYRNDPSISKYQSWSDYSYEDAVELFNTMKQVPFATIGHWFQLAIIENKSQQLIGDLAVHFIDIEQIEIGFTIAPEFQQKGYASEALSAFLDYVFMQLRKHRVVATTDALNIASCRLLEKAGFRREAHFIENIFFKGSWGSEYQYALLRSEWNK